MKNNIFKTLFKSQEIFRGVHNDFYKKAHSFNLNENEIISIKFEDFYFNSLTNPKEQDLMLIEKWKQSSDLQLSKEEIPLFKDSFKLPLSYCCTRSDIGNSYLIILCFEETQPMIYKICIEEIWKVEI